MQQAILCGLLGLTFLAAGIIGPAKLGDLVLGDLSNTIPQPSPVGSEPPPPDGAGEVRASRLFAGPGQYPPADFAAYGILAFPSRAVDGNRARFLFVCEAYLAYLPHATELAIPRSAQMVTVWPVDTDKHADALNRVRRDKVCAQAVEQYGLPAALEALKDAEAAGVDVAGLGPYLLAWSPAAGKGRPAVPVLVVDLGDVTTFEQCEEIFRAWAREIEEDPSLWQKGWTLQSLASKLQHLVDRWGPRLFRTREG